MERQNNIKVLKEVIEEYKELSNILEVDISKIALFDLSVKTASNLTNHNFKEMEPFAKFLVEEQETTQDKIDKNFLPKLDCEKIDMPKEKEIRYYKKSEIAKIVGLKVSRSNATFTKLGLQKETTTSATPYELTKLGKKWGGVYKGKGAKTIYFSNKAITYILEHGDELPFEWRN